METNSVAYATQIGFALLKFLYLAFIFLYAMFAFVIVRQIAIMTKTFSGALNLPLKTIGYLHLLLAIGVFVLALLIL